jgi:saccharopine dehydrogenase (NAD+, L-lysine-forming)
MQPQTINSQIFWLRSETKRNEYRRALTPDSCEKIIAAGHKVYVEDWAQSIIPTKNYTEIGCISVAAGSWQTDAPDQAIIIGLKALPDNPKTYKHTHIYFAHAYKEQEGWKDLLGNFKKDGGKIIDLEYMVNDQGRRVNAFGYWAGYVGAALGALFAKAENVDKAVSELQNLGQFPDKEDLIKFIKSHTKNERTGAIVIGCKGRSGAGASELLAGLAWPVTGWDIEETAPGGPFLEILNYELFVNCVLALSPMAPFITKDLIESNDHKLKIISDVSCDPDSECNMIPLYDEATVLSKPLIQVSSGESPVYLTAIDNLPSILPKEASYDFSNQLEAFIINYTETQGPVLNALEVFNSCSSKL